VINGHLLVYAATLVLFLVAAGVVVIATIAVFVVVLPVLSLVALIRAAAKAPMTDAPEHSAAPVEGGITSGVRPWRHEAGEDGS
jgi:hypothetical protein